ncbi:TauD/TfdA family dioxygenase [Candidatus Uabimicrobium sp. HlEnr_7]|uniref:TauD/TfdA family dioxygenase n=1 Tax=Candidatus Uabimicrobium helgolandensis TaxID=3095367 RepID=UPI0035575E83
MYSKINGPHVWYADDLQKSNEWQFQLNQEELREIDNALSCHGDVKNWSEITPQNFPLPQTSQKLLDIQKYIENDSGLALLKGFPRKNYNTQQLKAIFWAMAQYVGTPISQSADDEKIFSVRDAGFPTGHPKSRGPNTKNKLSFHTDRCDVISFFCVEKAKSGGENLIVSSPAIHNEILEKHSHLLPILYDTFYNKRHNVDAGNSKPFCQLPIFSQHDGHFAANIMRVLIFRACEIPEVPDLSPLQKEALEILEKIAHDPRMYIRFTQEPGDILFVNNFITFHSRTEFEDHEALEKKRHLLRIWLAVPNSRALSPLFTPNYGNTNAGAVRGGMKPHLYRPQT